MNMNSRLRFLIQLLEEEVPIPWRIQSAITDLSEDLGYDLLSFAQQALVDRKFNFFSAWFANRSLAPNYYHVSTDSIVNIPDHVTHVFFPWIRMSPRAFYPSVTHLFVNANNLSEEQLVSMFPNLRYFQAVYNDVAASDRKRKTFFFLDAFSEWDFKEECWNRWIKGQGFVDGDFTLVSEFSNTEIGFPVPKPLLYGGVVSLFPYEMPSLLPI